MVLTWLKLAGSKTTQLRLAEFLLTWLRLTEVGWLQNHFAEVLGWVGADLAEVD